MCNHPKVIKESQKIVGYPPNSGVPLHQWDELYPDGTVRTFREVWTAFTAPSGQRYGVSLVQPV